MSRNKIDPDLLAQTLAYASLHGDQAASKHFKISIRTLQRARANPDQCVQLADIVTHKKDVLLDKWAGSVPSALADCVAFVQQATQNLSAADPVALHAISSAIKALSEAQMNREVLEIWLEQNRTPTPLLE